VQCVLLQDNPHLAASASNDTKQAVEKESFASPDPFAAATTSEWDEADAFGGICTDAWAPPAQTPAPALSGGGQLNHDSIISPEAKSDIGRHLEAIHHVGDVSYW
jgi:hypothetical protein